MEKPRYELRNQILGKGMSGEVLLAYDYDNSIEVAAKLIPKKILENQRQMDLYVNEILISTKCENENLVKVHDIGDINDDKYLMFEYCNGGDLLTALKKYREKNGNYMEEKVVKNIITQILNGLNCLHQNNIVHHDIKPANILLNYDNEEDLKNLNFMKCKFKITDFGLSKNKYEIQERIIAGSPLYMEPKLFEKTSDILVTENEKIDIWSIGIITYELLFGKTPFETENIINTNKAIKELIDKLRIGKYNIKFKEREKISQQAIAFINVCLQNDQEKRASAEELLLSEFITKDIENFEYVNADNIFKLFVKSDVDEDYNILMDVNDDRKMNEKLNII